MKLLPSERKKTVGLEEDVNSLFVTWCQDESFQSTEALRQELSLVDCIKRGDNTQVCSGQPPRFAVVDMRISQIGAPRVILLETLQTRNDTLRAPDEDPIVVGNMGDIAPISQAFNFGTAFDQCRHDAGGGVYCGTEHIVL